MDQNFEENPFSEGGDYKTLPQGTIEIFRYVNETLNNRGEDTDVLRASAASQCYKQRWFKHNKYPSEPLNPRALLVFAFGDVVEHVMKHFIANACVGEGRLYSEVDFGRKTGTFTIQHREFDIYEQETLITYFEDFSVTGHPDGWGKRNSDGMWELIEIKSAASFGFDRFKRGETPDYIKQVHALMMARDVYSTRFFYMNKNTSHVFDRLYEFDPDVAEMVENEYRLSIQLEEPEAPYGFKDEIIGVGRNKRPSGRKLLESWKCSYCSYTKTCHKGIQMEYKSGKPIYFMEKT